MKTRGTVNLARELFDDPEFNGERFTRLHAWAWLIAEAAWERRTVRVNGEVFQLERGQVVASLRFLAQRWRWSEPAVRRFFTRRTRDAQVTLEPTRNATRITICNYNKWQGDGRTTRRAADAPPESKPTQKHKQQTQDSPSLRSDDDEESSSSLVRGRARENGSRLPNDWLPNALDIAEARRIGLTEAEIRTEVERFADHWHAKPGKDARKLDWHRTWCNWCRGAIDRRPRRGGGASSDKSGWSTVARELREHEQHRSDDEFKFDPES